MKRLNLVDLQKILQIPNWKSQFSAVRRSRSFSHSFLVLPRVVIHARWVSQKLPACSFYFLHKTAQFCPAHGEIPCRPGITCLQRHRRRSTLFNSALLGGASYGWYTRGWPEREARLKTSAYLVRKNGYSCKLLLHSTVVVPDWHCGKEEQFPAREVGKAFVAALPSDATIVVKEPRSRLLCIFFETLFFLVSLLGIVV